MLSDLHNTLAREETKWRHKSKLTWIQEGDWNTRFFKMTTFKHRAKNRILEVLNTQGDLTQDIKEIKET